MRRLVTLPLLSVLFTAAAGANAQPHQVFGSVLDPGACALAGARVEIRSGARVIASPLTAADGTFSADLAPGSYVVSASYPGFATSRREIDVRAPLEIEIVLPLSPLTEEVAVTATRNEDRTARAPQPVSVVAAEEIEIRQSTNLTEVLATLPGVHFTDSGPFRPRPILRGLDSNRLLVLVDGQRLNNGRTSTQNAGIEPGLIDVEQVERVEVVRGGGSVLHGSDAMAGVINIITRAPDRSAEPRLGGGLSADYYDVSEGFRLGGTAGFTSPGWALRIGGSFGEFQDYESADGVVPNSGAQESNVETTLSLYPSERDLLRVQWTTRHGRDIGIPGTTLASGFFATFPYDDRDKVAGFYSRDGAGSFGGLQANAHWQRQHRNFVNQVAAPGFSLLSATETDTRSLGFDAQVTRLASETHQLTFGTALFSDANSDLREQMLFPGAPFEMQLPSAPSVPDSRLTGWGLFLQDEWELDERVHVNLGIRGDAFRSSADATRGYEGVVSDPETNATLTGSAGLVFDLAPAVSVYGRVARAFRQPNLFERYFFGRGSVGGFVVPNPDLRPESAVDLEGGVRVRSRSAQLDLGYFYNRLRDLITTVPGTIDGSPTLGSEPVFTNANIDRAAIQGVEANLEIPITGLGQSFLVYSRNAYLYGENLTTSSPLPLIAPYVTTTGVRWYAMGATLIQDVEVQGVSGSDRVPDGQDPLEGYVLLHVRGQVRLSDSGGFLDGTPWAPTSLTWGISNLTDASYDLLFSGIPGEGLGVRLALSWGF